MQLFILGPAFGLPSIDAECIAAVALVQRYAKDPYELIPTHDEGKPMPHLIDGTAKLSGFQNIARHFVDRRLIRDDVPLVQSQRADSIAISSFIERNAQTLLDISLYVGFENYRLATQPAFSSILPWHANYIIPPQRRAAARSRTAHLGISSIDVDTVHEDMSNRPTGFDGVGKEQPQFEQETHMRASLLLPRKETIRSLLQRPEHAAVFKLNALADNFFEPLKELLGDKEYLLGTEQPMAVDALVYGHLALMLYPQMPQDWLATTMRRKYNTLVAYTDRIHGALNMATDADRVLALAKTDGTQKRENLSLPWTAPHRSTATETLQSIRMGLWEQLPLIGNPHKLDLWHAKAHSFLQRNLRTILLYTTTSIAVMGYLAVHTGLLVWPRGQDIAIFGHKNLSDFGHVGAALAGVSLMRPQDGSG